LPNCFVLELQGIFCSSHLHFSISVLISYLSTDLGECHISERTARDCLNELKTAESLIVNTIRESADF
jgi:hypothetical protein